MLGFLSQGSKSLPPHLQPLFLHDLHTTILTLHFEHSTLVDCNVSSGPKAEPHFEQFPFAAINIIIYFDISIISNRHLQDFPNYHILQ